LSGGSLRSEWLNWRAKIITDFLREIRNEVKSINPNVVISPMIYHRDEGMNVLWVKSTTEKNS